MKVTQTPSLDIEVKSDPSISDYTPFVAHMHGSWGGTGGPDPPPPLK